MSQFDTVQRQIVAACQALVAQGYLMATGGNVSVRVAGQQAMAITPSSFDYARMTPADVCVVDWEINPLAGEHQPSVESGMHAAIYLARSDVGAVVHTHQVHASALALIDAPIPALFDEQVRYLGRCVEIIPYAPSGTGLLRNKIARQVGNGHNAYLMKNHGALIFGHDLERALHNVEILEKCAVAYLLALCTGRKVSKIPLAVREIAFARLRKEEKKHELCDF
ncbi:MAG TPA: class II aldolase/adducin family protein [Anaerolineae bacterium]|nr:class II aldolase/adducin family protein [Anaerolineae bacterium]